MSKIKLFESKQIRSVWNEADQKWYFAVVDVVEALTDSSDPKQYIKKTRQRDPELNSYWGTICTPLEMTAKDGKKRKVLCAKAGLDADIIVRNRSYTEEMKNFPGNIIHSAFQTGVPIR